MRSGYLALVGLVVAYSTYQGADLSRQTSSEQSATKAGANTTRPATPVVQKQQFPVIGGGICVTQGDGAPTPTCGDCKAICPATELAKLIEDYFRAESGGDKEFAAAHWNVPAVEQGNLKFVFASLPDPVHTHMALLFDRQIETIERSAQANDYLFSRAWMPWDISAHAESSDFTERMAQTKYRDETESLPGLMIFHASDRRRGPGSILFVFVVSETPTGGLRKEQFQNALDIRRAMMAGAETTDEGKTLRIFGPNFSGSLASLNDILNAQKPHDRFSSIVIRSGSVSSFQAAQDFCKSTFAEWPEPAEKPNIPSSPNGRPNFATFQFSDEYQEFYLSLFFNQRQNLHSQVAILSEDETVFGNQDRPGVQNSDVVGSCPAEPPQPSFGFLRLYFPREIAQLRDAYQRDVKEQVATDNGKAPRQTGLPLSLSVTGNDDDSVATFSPLQTPLSQESILQSILVSLRKNHAKVVVIRGTDPLDVIFLSRYLRQNYPQARLVTLGLDLLMIHDLFDPRFHGILGVSPYPLLNGVQFPKSALASDQGIHRLFPDSYGVGDFNALMSLLATTSRRTGSFLPSADYAQFGLPSFLEGNEGADAPWRAHLWLTAVGREGYWPVAVLDDVAPDSGNPSRAPERSIRDVEKTFTVTKPFSVHFSIGWTILSTLCFAATLLLAYLVSHPCISTRSEILARFRGAHSEERNGLLFTLSMLLLAVQTLFFFPMIVWLRPFGFVWEGWKDLFGGMEVATVGYAVSGLLLGIACKKGLSERGAHWLANIGLAICVSAVSLCLLLTIWTWTGKLGSRLGAFTYRYIEVGSGVSPSLPVFFILAAWIWWCWQSLTGIGSTEEKDIVLPAERYLDEQTETDENHPREMLVPEASSRVRLKMLSSELNRHLWEALDTVPLGENGQIVISAFLAFGLIFLWMRPDEIAEAFEFTLYKWLYWILLYSCLLLLCYLLVHIVCLWLEFRNLLRAINRMPFRRGFIGLQSITWKPLWRLAGNGRQEFLELLTSELDALTNIEQSGVSESELRSAIDKAKNAEEVVSAKYELMLDHRASRNTPDEVQRLFHTLQEDLAVTASKALIYASAKWKNEAYLPAVVADTEKKESETTKAPVAPAGDPKMHAVEHFLCLFYLNVILVPLRRLQTLILAIAGVFVFVLMSYSSYPFESRESFHALLISVFFAMSLVVGIVYGQMYANPLLSLITNTEPGKLNLDFWVRIGSFVFIPLLSLVSVQFPQLNSFLFSWLQPALQSIK